MTPSLDAVLATAVDLARRALLEEVSAAHVGDHVETVGESGLVVTHCFACLDPAYVGWRWSVTLTRVEGSEHVTVDEVVLLPGAGSLLAPEWLPWSQRVKPSDLGPGDLYPTPLDDARLEPGYTGADALEADDETASTAAPLRPEQWQLGLGRETVLSAYGRGIAADRWYDGDFGPDAPMAKSAPGSCATCGFLMPIGGLVGQVFGVCANAFGADGRVVAFGYGCGAHSSVREIEGTGVPVTAMAVDELIDELVDLRVGDIVGVSTDIADDLSDAEVAESREDGALFDVVEVEPVAEGLLEASVAGPHETDDLSDGDTESGPASEVDDVTDLDEDDDLEDVDLEDDDEDDDDEDDEDEDDVEDDEDDAGSVDDLTDVADVEPDEFLG